jgi:hypothetical protein
MSADESRARLARRQAELLCALAGQGMVPEGFDAEQVQVVADALARKRLRSVVRAWPALARALGAGFAGRFQAYALGTLLPREGGPLADGRAFARFLAATGDLPEAGRWEALAVDLRYARCAGGLRPRRGPALKLALFRKPRRLVVALGWPGLGEKWLTLPLGWR